MSEHSSACRQAISLIEQIQEVGLPNSKNILEIESLVAQLENLSPNLKKAIYQVSVKELRKVVKNIENRIEKEGDIPVRMYTKLNIRLEVFKDNLINFH